LDAVIGDLADRWPAGVDLGRGRRLPRCCQDLGRRREAAVACALTAREPPDLTGGRDLGRRRDLGEESRAFWCGGEKEKEKGKKTIEVRMTGQPRGVRPDTRMLLLCPGRPKPGPNLVDKWVGPAQNADKN
jgi:hypothetical protein